MTQRALDDVRVLDLTRLMAGPYATLVLSDHGADVVKIESVPVGDPARASGVDYLGDQSSLFLMWNRGKRSVALDLRRPEGLAVVHRLAARADVVVENYRPGVADAIGVGFEQLSEINPRLVYCSISAFGSQGELAQLPGTDPVVQAVSGVMSVTGEDGGDPVLVGVPVADFTGAMLGVQGILFALLARERTGRGQRVDISMLHGMLSTLTTRLASYWTTGEDPQPRGSAHSTLVPYQTFATSDGVVMAGSFGVDTWPRFCEALGRPDMVEDERYATNLDRHANIDELLATVAAEFEKHDSDTWERRFRGAGALFGRVNSFSQIFGHPHVVEAGVIQETEHPSVGRVRELAPPIRMSEHQPRITRPAPLFGEHTAEVLEECGYGHEEIAALLGSGVAVQGDAAEAGTSR